MEVADFLSDPVQPAAFPETRLRWRNDRAGAQVGVDRLDDAEWIERFARFEPFAGSLPGPLALRYHGHQFGVYNPDLGDGRGFTHAQFRATDGRLLECGTKGSGQTPWSRAGDGRLTLKGAVRELMASELLEALGVPTARTLSIVETGEALERGDEPSPTRSAVLVRLAHGHIRIGSFQRLAALGEAGHLERLVRYALRHLHADPVAADLPAADAAAALLDGVVARTARLAAHYMAAGFVHGVLNTDNINVTGESFDYGPWRWTPTWDPGFTAAYFDHAGRYAFGRQPGAIHWAAGQLAVALRPLAEAEPLVAALETFGPRYQAAVVERFRWRLGLGAADADAGAALVAAMEEWMVRTGMPVADAFHRAATDALPPDAGALRDAIAAHPVARDPAALRALGAPETLLIDTVEAIWDKIARDDDWTPLDAKIAAIRRYGAALGGSAIDVADFMPLSGLP